MPRGGCRYNFGEVVQHPLLRSLEGTPDAWLGALLAAMHNGDIDAFNVLLADNERAAASHVRARARVGMPPPNPRAQAALVAGIDAVKQKVALLAVMQLAARLPPAERSIPFAVIAAATRLPLEQVRRCAAVARDVKYAFADARASRWSGSSCARCRSSCCAA